MLDLDIRKQALSLAGVRRHFHDMSPTDPSSF
jgi:hypothetical protein